MNQTDIIGWDIGGAHLKAVLMNNTGSILAVKQQACPLWQGIHCLKQAVLYILQDLNIKNPVKHAITMTGELVDCFQNRDEGVQCIIACMNELLMNEARFFFTGIYGFIPAHNIACKHYGAIASANWLASANLVAQRFKKALFIDIGSTTTDILLVHESKVAAQGLSDYARLCSGELLYTGIVRTPVMAITRFAPYEAHATEPLTQGSSVGIMAEYFATMADVYRLTGELNEAHDLSDTCDGAEKTILASARRLSRMIGCDFYPHELARWQRLAGYFRAEQLNQIEKACQLQLMRFNINICPLIGAGIGRFLVADIARNLQQPYIDFNDLLVKPQSQSMPLQSADCAPAIAVAYLLLTFISNK